MNQAKQEAGRMKLVIQHRPPHNSARTAFNSCSRKTLSPSLGVSTNLSPKVRNSRHHCQCRLLVALQHLHPHRTTHHHVTSRVFGSEGEADSNQRAERRTPPATKGKNTERYDEDVDLLQIISSYFTPKYDIYKSSLFNSQQLFNSHFQNFRLDS